MVWPEVELPSHAQHIFPPAGLFPPAVFVWRKCRHPCKGGGLKSQVRRPWPERRALILALDNPWRDAFG